MGSRLEMDLLAHNKTLRVDIIYIGKIDKGKKSAQKRFKTLKSLDGMNTDLIIKSQDTRTDCRHSKN